MLILLITLEVILRFCLFAKVLIQLGKKDAAKALNQAVRVLGDGLGSELVISKIRRSHGLL